MGVLKSRLTVVESLYHQASGEEGMMVSSRFSRDLESDDQAYGPRRLKATEEWQPLDCGWVEEMGMVSITNEEGKRLQVNPTEKEKEATAKKVLELALTPNPDSLWSFLIPPGESFRGYPSTQKLWIRSQSGITRFSNFVIPK